MAVKTYDPKKILISIGSHMVTGYAEGTFVSIEPNSDGVSKEVGCDGEIVRSLSPDRSYKVTITVLQTSPTVAFAQKQYDMDMVTGEGIFPIMIKDLTGGVIFSSDSAWFVSSPSREYAKEASERELNIDTGDATYTE